MKGNEDITMTESELVSFFGTTWMELNRRLQTLIKSPNLHHNKRSAGEEEVIRERAWVMRHSIRYSCLATRITDDYTFFSFHQYYPTT